MREKAVLFLQGWEREEAASPRVGVPSSRFRSLNWGWSLSWAGGGRGSLGEAGRAEGGGTCTEC